MFAPVSQWWEKRVVYLRRGTIYRAVLGSERRNFTHEADCVRFIEIQNAHVLAVRQAAPYVQLPIV